MMLRNFFGFIISIIFAVIYEHVGRLYGTIYRPSTFLIKIASICRQCFRIAGENMAWLSSYLILIDIKEIWRTVNDIGRPTIDIIISPVHFLYGYYTVAKTYADKTSMIYIGTLLIMILVCIVIHKLLLKCAQINIIYIVRRNINLCIGSDFF